MPKVKQQTTYKRAPRVGNSERGKGFSERKSQEVIPREIKYPGALSGYAEDWMPGFPARTRSQLRYASFGSLTSTSGAVATHVFSANGLFDPDITSTGHQPMAFDQMMVWYNHYYVMASKIIVTFKNTTTSTVPQACLRIDANLTPITVADQILEQGLLATEPLEPKDAYGANKTLQLQCNIKKVQGVKDVLDVTELSGTAAANPAEQTYFHVQTWNSAAVSGSLNFDVIIEYDVWFCEPRTLTESMAEMSRQTARNLLRGWVRHPSELNQNGASSCAVAKMR